MPLGSVETSSTIGFFPADGERIANETFATDGRAWCAMKGASALELDRYLDEI